MGGKDLWKRYVYTVVWMSDGQWECW